MDWIGSYRGGHRGEEYRDPYVSPLTDLWDPFSYRVNNNWDVINRRGGGGGGGGGDGGGDDITSLAHAHVDWRETDTAHIFRADLPGVKKEDLKVLVEDNKILQISGERVKEQQDQNHKWHRVERQTGSFMRRFRLPEDAKTEQIGCTLENGVLTVTVPKVERKLERKINVIQIDVA